ncbi:protein madd-4 isoform X1 [Cotesia glomerata]|uniref:protein madd-4 isoform X1 n=1 Tax=Cotesia glomerata TaxID=32391 RepID=UPI001D0171CD|nr:protein madd-4 isoform X1 [Cotesia glomerata]
MIYLSSGTWINTKRRYCINMYFFQLLMCFLGLVFGDNSTIDNISALSSTGHADYSTVSQITPWGEWTPWSKWSPCTRSCGGGLSRQQRRCKRKPCKGKSSVKFKICNNQACEIPTDFRAEQCSAFDDIPYRGKLLKWYPYDDPTKPCSLICHGVSSRSSTLSTRDYDSSHQDDKNNKLTSEEEIIEDSFTELDTDDSIVVQLADKVQDGTRCHTDSFDICIGGTCLIVGCDMKVGSGKTKDLCGVCGGNGSTCQSKYSWSLESISACSKSCGGGFKMAAPICKSLEDDSTTDEENCNLDKKPTKTILPCNMHPCATKWISGEWSKCSASCGGGSRTRPIYCTEKNENDTIKLPDHRCNASHKPKTQETCNTISCPMWETDQWSECSATCGTGVRTRTIECRDGNGKLSNDCDSAERPYDKQDCKTNINCPLYSDEISQPLMQPYPPPPMPEKLIDQPIPSEATFIADEWSTCSATCGEGIRHREVHCKIFLEFSRTIAKLPDRQCTGPKPVETEKCMIRACGLMENNLSYRVDTVGDSGYEESNLMDSFRSASSDEYEGSVKVATGNSGQTTYSWKEAGYSACTASCLGGVQDLIINCVRDDTGKTVIPLLCTKETKPESRIRTCNDHACTPRWNYSDFSPCNSPCGIGIQTRDVTCIHEVARGPGNTVVVPNHMCQTPPPVDRQHCNVWDCPPKWQPGEWDKCSKSCGGGIKRRQVVCEQVMAQGHKQIRPDRECQGNKPSSEKPCNTRSCYDIGLNVQPVIFSQNTTFYQRDPEQKVDLKIGGTATVFQGIPVVKIRCPVKKFSKGQIIWTKDRAELHKSRKYKISRKGALKIIDIGITDSGSYACIAGQSHAELRLIVRPRTREQMSSEEILRFGNTVNHRQDVNLDSGGASSGENLQIDRAAPAYQGAFSFGNDDLSHESRPEIPSVGKPTKKPRRPKRPKPSPPTSDVISNGEYSVTSIHQPGYHESVESTASSSASRLTPHFSQLISTLQSYWPFQNGGSSNRGHRMAPELSPNDFHSKNTLELNTKDPKDNDVHIHYDSVDKDFDMFGRNSVIPDDKFGPDEERIFIEDEPYDFDSAISSMNAWDNRKKSTESLRIYKHRFTTEQTSDYFEESLRNIKNQNLNNNVDNYLRNERGIKLSKKNSEKIYSSTETSTIDIYFQGHTDDKNKITEIYSSTNPQEKSYSVESQDKNDYSKPHHSTTGTSPTPIISNDKSTIDLDKIVNYSVHTTVKSIVNDNVKLSTESLTIKLPEDDEKMFDSGSEMEQIEDSYEEELIKQKLSKNETAKLSTNHSGNNSKISSDEIARENDSENIDHGAVEVLSNEDTTEKTRHSKHKNHSHNSLKNKNSNQPLIQVETLTFDINDTTDDTFNIFTKETSENLVFEWVTTEWSKCSQTCGGGGFQMRGAQCMVRSTKPASNNTRVSSRTVIGASLCEDAGFNVPAKVRPCGLERCPQWHASEWTPCESSRCFNWKTAMQRRDVTCRLIEDAVNGSTNATILNTDKCDDAIRPPQRQECYNDVCKGVWRVGEWSECTASCEEDGIKYRILQCVWFGTKKPAGNACRDIPRPPVMKICKGSPCPRVPEDCEDHSPLCTRVKMMNMCRVPLYQKQCCKSCR